MTRLAMDDTASEPRTLRTRVHMHPMKSKLVFGMSMGGLLCLILVCTGMHMIVHPLQQWDRVILQSAAQFQRIDALLAHLRNRTLDCEIDMKLLLQRVQHVHATASTRTEMVGKMAAHVYREQARDRLHGHQIMLRESVLFEASQMRLIDAARGDLARLDEAARAELARMRDVPIESRASLEDSLEAVVAASLKQMESIQKRIAQDAAIEPMSKAEALVCAVLLGVLSAWLWSIVGNDAERRKGTLAKAKKAFARWIGAVVVIESLDKTAEVRHMSSEDQSAAEEMKPLTADQSERLESSVPRVKCP